MIWDRDPFLLSLDKKEASRTKLFVCEFFTLREEKGGFAFFSAHERHPKKFECPGELFIPGERLSVRLLLFETYIPALILWGKEKKKKRKTTEVM